MKEAIFPLKATLSKGLGVKYNVRNRPFLIQSIGAFPFEDVLQSVKQFSRIDTTVMGALVFPYPQLFVLNDVIVVTGPTSFYEYDGSNLTLKIDGLTEVGPWTVLDYKVFLYFSNGSTVVIKNPANGSYQVSYDYPASVAACDFHGQALIAHPQVTVNPISTHYLLDSSGNYVLDASGNKIPLS